jgi:acyl dehydratase
MKLKPMYFEDFSVGMTFQTDETLISKNEIIDFASKYDPQSFHLDEEEAKKGPDLDLGEGGGKNVRTLFHGRHVPNLPGREITIEGTSIKKHCTTATKKSPRIKIG